MSASRASRLWGAVLILVCVVIVWTPLPLGSNRPVFWPVNGLFVVLILSLLLLGPAKQINKPDPQLSTWLLAGLTLVVLWMLAQAIPFSADALSHPLRSRFGQGISGSYDAISANPSTSFATVAQVAPPVVLTAVAAIIGRRSRENAMLLVKAVAFSATAFAVYGMAALYFDFDQVPLIDSDTYEGSLTGTFVGRNAAATYLAIGLVCAVALLADRVEASLNRSLRPPSSGDFLSSIFITNIIYVVAVAILLSGLLKTGSRAGVASGLAGLLVVGLVSWRRVIPGRQILAGSMFLLILLIGIAAASSTFLRHRFETVDLATDLRFPLYRDTLQMIVERPLLGHGAGSFADVFPLFQSAAPVFLAWNRAHSTFMQVAAELGLPVFVFLLLIAAICVGRIAKCAADRHAATPAAAAALGAFTTVALHSLVDFSLQIQAVGMIFAVVAGVGYGEAGRILSHDDRSPLGVGAPAGCSEPRGRHLPFCALLVTGIAIIAFAELRLALVVGAMPRQLWLEEIPLRVLPEASVDPRTTARAETVSGLIRDPALVTARLAPCQAERATAREQSDVRGFFRATQTCVSIVDDALTADPLSGELWLERSKLLFGQPSFEAEFERSMRRACETAPRVGWLATRRVLLGVQAYPSLGEGLRGLVKRDLDLVLATPSLAALFVSAVVGSERLRDLVVPIVETLRPERQQAFFGLLEAKSYGPATSIEVGQADLVESK